MTDDRTEYRTADPRPPRLTDAELASAVRAWAQALANQRTLQDPVALITEESIEAVLLRNQLRADRNAAEMRVYCLADQVAWEIVEAGKR